MPEVIKLNDSGALDSHGVDKRNMVEEIPRAYAHQIFIDGFFNADPHPGLWSALNVSVSYYRIIKPIAKSALECDTNERPMHSAEWVCDSPVNSAVEAKLRPLLVQMGNADKILGIQVCAYKNGKVIIDTAAGVLGNYDPSPAKPDTLFPVFSVTKGITAGMLQSLFLIYFLHSVNNGKTRNS